MKIYLASGNQHKLSELLIALQQAGLDDCEVFSANLIGGMPEVDETGDTFEANAILKAKALRLEGPKEAFYLSDDSGIEIDHLNGRMYFDNLSKLKRGMLIKKAEKLCA